MDSPEIEALVRTECNREPNVFGPSFFDEHAAVVVRYATALAERLHADREIVAAAAWLHDLAAVKDASALPRHAAEGAVLASEILKSFGWPEERAARVAACVASHSTPVAAGTAEEICVSHADAMAQIARPLYWAWMVYGLRRSDFADGRAWLLSRYEQNWLALNDTARAMIQAEYSQARAILASS